MTKPPILQPTGLMLIATTAFTSIAAPVAAAYGPAWTGITLAVTSVSWNLFLTVALIGSAQTIKKLVLGSRQLMLIGQRLVEEAAPKHVCGPACSPADDGVTSAFEDFLRGMRDGTKP